jgi:competence protein ComEC
MRPRALAIALCGLAAVMAATLPGGLFGGHDSQRPKLFTISFLDVGQGDAILLQPPGRAVLVDGGPPEADVAALLRRHGVGFLDVAVLTHPQRDHQGGLETVLRRLPVGLLLDGGSASHDPTHRRIATLARNAGTRVVTAAAGQFLRVGGLKLTVLSPREPFDPDAGEPNVQAVVLLASYRGLDALLPADAESDVTLGIAKRTVEVLKVAHHGSEDERLGELLHHLRPQVAVIEVGAHNPYGHPRPGTLARLRAAHAILRRTDLNGEVRVSLGPNGPLLESDHEPDRQPDR